MILLDETLALDVVGALNAAGRQDLAQKVVEAMGGGGKRKQTRIIGGVLHLSYDAAAAHLKVGKSTVRNYAQKGELTTVKMFGRHYFAKPELDKLLKNRKSE